MISLRHIGITVVDMEKMQNFYCDLLGCKLLKTMEESGEVIDNFSGLKGIEVTTTKMELPKGGVIELLKYHSPKGNDVVLQNIYKKIIQVGISHYALSVNDLDSLYENLMKEEISFFYKVQTSPDGNVKIAFCRDPEGNILELVEELK
jgi:catechol 2,3-dioxygenase-like lactoylglutathione lyase family enzyme